MVRANCPTGRTALHHQFYINAAAKRSSVRDRPGRSYGRIARPIRHRAEAVAGLIVSGWVSAVIGSAPQLALGRQVQPHERVHLDGARPVAESEQATATASPCGAATLSSCIWAIGLTVIAAADLRPPRGALGLTR